MNFMASDPEPDEPPDNAVEAEQPVKSLDPLLALWGSGKHIWADEHADEYVANLRKDWD
jgi:hypothetical protein